MRAGKYIWTGGRPREVVVKIGHCGTETSRRPVVHVWVGSRCAIITYLNGIGHDLQTPVRFGNAIGERKRSRCCVRFGHRGTSVHDHIQRTDTKLKNCPTRFQFGIRRHKKVKVKLHRDRVDMSYQSFLKHQSLSPPLKGMKVGGRMQGSGSNQAARINI